MKQTTTMRVEIVHDTIRIIYQTGRDYVAGIGSVVLRITRGQAVQIINQANNPGMYPYRAIQVADNIWLDISASDGLGTFVSMPSGLAVTVSKDDIAWLVAELADAVESIDIDEVVKARARVGR